MNLRAGALRAGWERGHFRGGDRHHQPFSFTLKNFSPLEIVKLIFWHLPSKIFMGETPQQPACSPGADRSLCWAEVHHQPFSPLPSKIYLAGWARPSPRGWDQQKILRLRGGRVGVPTTGREDGSAQSRLPATRWPPEVSSGRGRFLNLRAGALRAGWERGHFRGGDRHHQPFSFTLKNFSPLEIVKLIFWHLPSKIFMGETPQQPACSPGADRSLCWAEVHHQPFSPLPSKIYLAGWARPSPRGWDQQKILRLRGGRVGVPTTGREDGSAQSRLPATRWPPEVSRESTF